MAVTFCQQRTQPRLNLGYRDTDRPTGCRGLGISLGRYPSFDEEELAENPELAEMMGEFDSYNRWLFISVDQAHEQARIMDSF